MKGFLQEYGIMMVVVSVVLGMLSFGKTAYAKGIQDAILGSADHIVETGENITKKEVHVTSGDTLDIEGTKYVVLEQKENSQALVMTASSIGYKKFQSSYDSDTKLRPDGQNANTYEGSEIDNYLENEWYNRLPSTVKAAIQATNIKQVSYACCGSGIKQETGYNGQVYNTISRHAFLPNISEIRKAVKPFLDSIGIWTRDSYQDNAISVEFVYTTTNGYMYNTDFRVNSSLHARPAFVIDLSKVDYTEVGHVDYKGNPQLDRVD